MPGPDLDNNNKERGGRDKLNWVIKLNVLKEKQERLLRQNGYVCDVENF